MRSHSPVGVAQLWIVRPRETLRYFGAPFVAEIFDFSFRVSERKLVADLSRFSFAGSDAGEQELPRDFSAEIFVGCFYADLRSVA